MVEINSDIQGLKELSKNVDKLSKSFARTTLRTALRNAAKPVRQEARALVAVESGDLKGAIGVKVTVTKAGDGYADVGLRRATSFTAYSLSLGTSQQRASARSLGRRWKRATGAAKSKLPLLTRSTAPSKSGLVS